MIGTETLAATHEHLAADLNGLAEAGHDCVSEWCATRGIDNAALATIAACFAQHTLTSDLRGSIAESFAVTYVMGFLFGYQTAAEHHPMFREELP